MELLDFCFHFLEELTALLLTDGQYPTDCKEFARRIFYTVYMGTENSSDATRSRAKLLADEIGSWHLDVSIDSVVSSLLSLFQTLTGKRPLYKVDGGTNTENLALQNNQARIRMVVAYMLATLLPWVMASLDFILYWVALMWTKHCVVTSQSTIAALQT